MKEHIISPEANIDYSATHNIDAGDFMILISYKAVALIFRSK